MSNPYADPVAGIYSEAGQAWADGVAAAISVIDQHIPSLTDEDELEISKHIDIDGYGYVVDDYADLAYRTCSCGVKIDGFYEYVDHLKEMLKV